MIVDLRVRQSVGNAGFPAFALPAAGQLEGQNDWTKGVTPDPIEKLHHRQQA